MTGYSRDQFGPAWTDTDHNGCDQRNDALARALTAVTYKPGTNNCVVLTGRFVEPYSGKPVTFQRGQTTSSLVQIDHVVALADAWQSGAQQWDAGKRLTFANDALNLLAVDGRLNGQKGASNAASWLPPNKSYRCAYVARQVAVKAKYGLWVTAAEKSAMRQVLTTCLREPLPTGAATTGPAPAPAARAQVPAKPTPPSSTPVPRSPVPESGVTYANCAAVRAAGKAPLRASDPGYSSKLDRDGDGIACE